MPVHYGNANYRKKHDAFQVIDEAEVSPLKEAIRVAQEMRETTARLIESLPSVPMDQRGAVLLAIARAKPDELMAWIKIAEFVYSKPRHVTVEAHMTYEQLIDGSYKTVAVDTGVAIAEPPTSH